MKKLVNKYKSMSKPAKAAIWFAVASIMQKGIQFVTTPIFTRLLTTAQYGQVSIYLTWVNIASIFLTLNLYMGGFNNGMIKNQDKRDEYLSSIQGLVVTITSVFFIVFLFTRDFWSEILEMDSTIISIMFLEILFHSSLYLWAAKERFEFRYKKLLFYTVLVSLIPSVAAITGILLSPREKGADAKIIWNAAFIIALCIPLFVTNLKKGKHFFNKDFWIFALKFNIPLIPHYLSGVILNQADRIMISRMVGDSEAGIYSLAYSAAMVLNVITTAMNQSFAPWLYDKLNKKDYDGIKTVTTPMFIGVSVMIFILVAFAPEAILLFGGNEYKDAIWIVPSVAASLYFNFIFLIYANVEFFYMKNRYISYASIIGAILNIVLNYFGIMVWGYLVAGYTTLICYMLFAISHFVFVRSVINKNIGRKSLFDDKAVFGIGLVLVLLSISILFAYEHMIVRYLIVAFVIFIVVINKNKLINIVRELKNK